MNDIEKILYKMRVNLDGYKNNQNDPELKFFYDQQFYVDCELFDNEMDGLDPVIWGNYLERYETLLAEKEAPYKIKGNQNANEIRKAIEYYEKELKILLDAYEKEIITGVNLDVIYRQKGRINYYIEDMRYNDEAVQHLVPIIKRLKQIYSLQMSNVQEEKGLSK